MPPRPRERRVRDRQSISIASAMPWPPPMHSVSLVRDVSGRRLLLVTRAKAGMDARCAYSTPTDRVRARASPTSRVRTTSAGVSPRTMAGYQRGRLAHWPNGMLAARSSAFKTVISLARSASMRLSVRASRLASAWGKTPVSGLGARRRTALPAGRTRS